MNKEEHEQFYNDLLHEVINQQRELLYKHQLHSDVVYMDYQTYKLLNAFMETSLYHRGVKIAGMTITVMPVFERVVQVGFSDPGIVIRYAEILKREYQKQIEEMALNHIDYDFYAESEIKILKELERKPLVFASYEHTRGPDCKCNECMKFDEPEGED